MKKKLISVALVLTILLTALPATALAASREGEPNDSAAQATQMQLNTQYVGNLSNQDDVDWYKFTLSAADMVTVTYDFKDGNPAMSMTVYDASNKQLIHELLKGSDLILPKTTARLNMPAGTYYIKIEDKSWAGAVADWRNEDYYLTVNAESGAAPTPTPPVTTTPTPQTPGTPIGGNREVEPNNAANQATTIETNKQYVGNLSNADDTDWYRFTLAQPSMVTLSFDFRQGNPAMSMDLYDSANKSLLHMGLKGTDLIFPQNSDRYNLPAGTYFLQVEDKHWAGAVADFRNEDYFITVSATACEGNREIEYNDAANQGTAMELNKQYVGNLSNDDDVDWYKFTTTQSGSVSILFDFKNGNPAMGMAVFDASNKQVLSETHKGTSLILPIASKIENLAAGTYYIKIEDKSWAGASADWRNEDYYLTVSTGTGAVVPTPAPGGSPNPADPSASGGASSWAQGEVSQAIALGFVPSELQSNYQANITRQEFCKLMVNMLMAKSGTLNNQSAFTSAYNVDLSQNPFSDTADQYIKIAYALQIVNGTGNGLFSPHNNITRQEAAAMLQRAAAVFQFTTSLNSPTAFGDKGAVASWASAAVDFVSANGIMGGVGSGQFSPHTNYTREQSTLTALRLYNAFPRSSYAI